MDVIIFFEKQGQSFILTFHLKKLKWTELWTSSFKIEMVNYERELFIFILCELNFELVHENYELAQHWLTGYSWG